MCNPAIALAAAAAVVSAGGALYAGKAADNQGKYEQAVAKQNADLEREASTQAQARGEKAQMQHYREVAQRLGMQRATLAASGLDTGFGTPADLLGDTAMLGQEDALTLSENTANEVRGYDINAANYVNQGNAARMKGKAEKVGSYFRAGSTLLSAASQSAKPGGSGANFGKTGP